MEDLKRRIKAGTAKTRCHTISERSLTCWHINAVFVIFDRQQCFKKQNKKHIK